MKLIRQVVIVTIGLLLAVVVALNLNWWHYYVHPTITRTQQENVVRRIARVYDVTDVEFTKFTRNTSTGYCYLLFKINQSEEYKTGIVLDDLSWLDMTEDNEHLELDPIATFKVIKKVELIPNTEFVDISHVHIKYLGE